MQCWLYLIGRYEKRIKLKIRRTKSKFSILENNVRLHAWIFFSLKVVDSKSYLLLSLHSYFHVLQTALAKIKFIKDSTQSLSISLFIPLSLLQHISTVNTQQAIALYALPSFPSNNSRSSHCTSSSVLERTSDHNNLCHRFHTWLQLQRYQWHTHAPSCSKLHIGLN